MMRWERKSRSHFHKKEPFLLYSGNTYLKHRVPKKNLKDQKKPVNDAEAKRLRRYCCRDSIINPFRAKLRKTKIKQVTVQMFHTYTHTHTGIKPKKPI